MLILSANRFLLFVDHLLSIISPVIDYFSGYVDQHIAALSGLYVFADHVGANLTEAADIADDMARQAQVDAHAQLEFFSTTHAETSVATP